jgi:hypothetical protein
MYYIENVCVSTDSAYNDTWTSRLLPVDLVFLKPEKLGEQTVS